MKNLFKQVVVVLLIASMALTVVGCYGSFTLTKKVYNWNGTMGNKWVVELVFLVCSVVPVYAIAGFLDGVILNSLEFWTGNNPMASMITSEDGTKVAFNAETKQATVSYGEKKFTVGVVNGKATVLNEKGEAVAYVESDDAGNMMVKDMKGNVLNTQSKAEVMAMLN